MEILSEFFDIRLEAYAKRKQKILMKLKRDLALYQNKFRFIELINSKKLDL
jgi:DNA topoisomerase-2